MSKLLQMFADICESFKNKLKQYNISIVIVKMCTRQVVLVEQGCDWSCCTPTLLDVQAVRDVTGSQKSVFSDSANVPQSTAKQQ